MGVLHSYLISRGNEESSSHEISPEMDNQYETIHIRSQRGSDASSVGNTPSTRNSIMDIDGMGRDRKPSEDTNGTANKRNNLENSTSSTKKLGHGFAIMQRSTYLAANVDIMFQIVCFASIIFILGLPLYSYFHGWSLAISILPAMIAAHITAIVIVIPFVNIYQKKKEEWYSRKSFMNPQHELSFFNYFLKRFGGSDYDDTSYKDANHIDVPNPTSTTNISFRILLVLTWLLIFVLWAFIAVCNRFRFDRHFYSLKDIVLCLKIPMTFHISRLFQSITLYGVAAIVERIRENTSTNSKLYTIIIAAFYTAVEGEISTREHNSTLDMFCLRRCFKTLNNH